MSDLGKILGELYKPNYEYTFRNHPNKDEIIPHLVNGTFESTTQVDLWFEEADSYNFKSLMSAPKNDNGDGTVTFKVVE